MKIFSSPRRRVRLLAAIFGLGFGFGCTAPLLAQTLPFSGRWEMEEPTPLHAPAPYAVLSVKGDRLAWSASKKAAPTCIQHFEVKPEKPGTVYTDGRGTRFVAGSPGSIPTYLLKLGSTTCPGIEEEIRIRYPLVYDVGHIEIIEYVKGKPVSSRRFSRLK
jgi:hypothetical protein